MTDLARKIRFKVNQSNSFILLKYIYKVVNGKCSFSFIYSSELISYLKSIKIILTAPAFR